MAELSEYHAWWKKDGARGLRLILMGAWDPIGVADAPQAQDEYDSYLGPLVGLLRDGAEEEQVTSYLAEIRTERMGMAPRTSDDRRAARAVMDWWRQEKP